MVTMSKTAAVTLVNYHNWPIIEIYHDHVIVCGKRVERPFAIAPSQWLQFWEKCNG